MSEPLVSIVIPNYNYAEYLPEAVGSAAHQSYPAKELIVIDDCSADASMTVLEELHARYADTFSGGMHIERLSRNAGAHAAINRGVEKARGKHIAVLNADDIFEPNRLTEMLDRMTREKSGLAFSAVKCVGRNGEALDDEFSRKMGRLPESANGARFVALAAVAENVAVSTGNMVFEKSLHAKLGGFRSYRYVHDYDFLFRAALTTEPVYVPATSYFYRLHGDNTFTRLADIGIAENRLVWLEMYAAIKAGRISNPRILREPDYVGMFREAAHAYGFQKKVMWNISGTVVGSIVAGVMRKRIQGSADH